jgi:hypothetical protein
MRIRNVHHRELAAPAAEVGALVDSLASPDDRLWPSNWPRMRFDRPLGPGAAGGHGPIRYVVEEHVPGESVRFRFTGPKGFDGFHRFDVSSGPGSSTVLRHTLRMTTHGAAVLSWPLVFRPLHDALIEDALTTAEESLGLPATRRSWSTRVRLLRWLLSGRPA